MNFSFSRTSLWKLTNLNEGTIGKVDLADPLTVRGNSSVTSFNERFLFVTGGESLASVEYYDIDIN